MKVGSWDCFALAGVLRRVCGLTLSTCESDNIRTESVALWHRTSAPPLPEVWHLLQAMWHRRSQNWDAHQVAEGPSVRHIDFTWWGFPAPEGPSHCSLRFPKVWPYSQACSIFYSRKCKRAVVSIVPCSAIHICCAADYNVVDTAFSLGDKWTPHGERDPTGPLGNHSRSCCFSVLNGSLGPGRGFVLLPKVPGKHPGSRLGEKLLH